MATGCVSGDTGGEGGALPEEEELSRSRELGIEKQVRPGSPDGGERAGRGRGAHLREGRTPERGPG